MKRILTHTALIVVALLAARPVAAQALAGETVRQEALYHDSFNNQPERWWDALYKQLTRSLYVPNEELDPRVLQNITYFATNHRDKVQFNRLAPRILDVYRNHSNESVRIMALATLHAIGDTYTMEQLQHDARRERSETVRRVALAAVVDFYQQQD